MKEETTDKASRIASALIDTKLKGENQEGRIINPLDHLRHTTAEFIQKRFNKIQEENKFEDLIIEAISIKIKTGEVSLNDLATLLNQTKLRSIDSVESLLQFFKPSGDRGSILETGRDSKSGEGEIFTQASPEDLRIIDNLVKLLNANKGDNGKT